MAVAHKRETEQRLKMHYLVAMNVQGMTKKHNSATVLAVQVHKYFHYITLKDLSLTFDLTLQFFIDSKLLMGCME